MLFLVPARECLVSFTDCEGISHSVTVAAATLYEAAVLAIVAFKRSEFLEVFAENVNLFVTVKEPGVTHEVPVRKLKHWLAYAPKSPKETVEKKRLLELLAKVG